MSGPHPDQAVLAEPMASRWSPRVFSDSHVIAPDQVEVLLGAARWAPSCGNAQPARFVVAPRGSAAHGVVVGHLSRGNAWWVPRASLVLLVGAQHAPDEEGEWGYKPVHADLDTGQALAHLSLQAVAMGLVTHPFAGFDRDAVSAELGVPSYVRLLAGLAVGVLGEDGEPGADKPRQRRVLDEVAHGDAWGRPWREAWAGGTSG